MFTRKTLIVSGKIMGLLSMHGSDDFPDPTPEEQKRLIDNLTNMLKRTLLFAEAMIKDHAGFKMPKDIQQWWEENK